MKISSRAGSGTGWIFATEDGTAYIVSNSHVLPTIHNPTVSVPNLGEYEAEVLGGDRNLDIAVIRICCSQDFVHLEIADVVSLRLGDDLTALGYPLGVDSINVTRTILTGFNTDSTTGRLEIQTDATANPGDSGGPLITATGEVVGINTYRIDETGEATVFAISSETFGDAIADLKTHPVRTFESPEHIRFLGGGIISVVEGTTNPLTRPIPAAATRQAKNLFVRYTFEVDNWLPDKSLLATSWGVAFRVTSGARYVLVLSTRHSWMLFLERDGEPTLVQGGPIRLTGGGVYRLKLKVSFSLLVKEDQGWLFTGDSVYFLDLSEHVVVGELHTVANYLSGDEQPVQVKYTVEAWRIAPVYKAINQSVVSVGDQRVALPAGNVSGRFFAFATFVNPAAPGPGLDSWSYGIALRQSGNIDRMVVVSTDGALDLLSIEGTLIRLWELTSVRLTRSEGASSQMIVGHTNLTCRFDLISANNPEMS
ncbi:MAG: trypsin-like peptidase domain-containing protein, partial [Chloroflexi bacterium]|nr:trypsin-like peptidase domain-containing protein [Chloroflexota bacterium]